MSEPIGSFDSLNDVAPAPRPAVAAQVARLGCLPKAAGIALAVIGALLWFASLGDTLTSGGWSDPSAAPYLAALAGAVAYLGGAAWLLRRRPVQAPRVPAKAVVAATTVVVGAAVAGLVTILGGGHGCTANVEMIGVGQTLGTAPAMLSIPVLFRVRQGALALLPIAIVLVLLLLAASAIPSGLFACSGAF